MPVNKVYGIVMDIDNLNRKKIVFTKNNFYC